MTVGSNGSPCSTAGATPASSCRCFWSRVAFKRLRNVLAVTPRMSAIKMATTTTRTKINKTLMNLHLSVWNVRLGKALHQYTILID